MYITNRNSSLVIAPTPTGVFNAATAKALAVYKQEKSKHKGMDKVYYDKHIDPIQGGSRAFGTNHLWAIVKMQSDVMNGLVMNGIYDGSVHRICITNIPRWRLCFNNSGSSAVKNYERLIYADRRNQRNYSRAGGSGFRAAARLQKAARIGHAFARSVSRTGISRVC